MRDPMRDDRLMPNGPGQQRRPPLTIDDMLLLLGRRLLLPFILSVAATGVVLLFLFGPVGGDSSPRLVPELILIPAAFILAGLVLVGIPAGYLVARSRHGFGFSFGLLVLIGFGTVFFLFVALSGGEGAFIALPLALFGALTAAIWTACNADLFRL